ncbi:MAG: alpha/beta hydrolase [Proteobacteria bacterium]|nr:alpha/beta hydrolase [Pseudomonadota bacterium]
MDQMVIDSATATAQLADGRKVAYCEYGAPDGIPLIALHGTPGSRINWRSADSAARANGLRLIAPDRAGCGRSDPKPNRTIIDAANDVAEFTDILGIEKFLVIGLSGGGPHAAATAWKLPDRVIGAALVSGMGPQTELDVWQELGRGYRLNFGLIRSAPIFARVAAAVMRRSVRSETGFVMSRLAAGLPSADQRIMDDPRMKVELMAAVAESFYRGGSGAVRDLILFSRPWDFRLEEIAVPVLLWHGTEDAHTPIVMGRFVAARIPGCQATFLDGAGHLWLFENFATVFSALTKLAA